MTRMSYSFMATDESIDFYCDNKEVFSDVKNYIERVLESEAYRGIPQRMWFTPEKKTEKRR